MKAIVTTGNGGYDKLVYTDVPVPKPSGNDVLVRVLAAGVNNTDINTRLGWYSDGGWNEATPFPLIQGTDCCGTVVELGADVDADLRDRRILVRSCMRSRGFDSMETVWMGSDFDGAFAEYVSVPAAEVFPVRCDWSDEELATIPCAYATAENMVQRARVRAGERVLVAGASGGVGSAAVQLAKRRGAEVVAITGAAKTERVRAIGADRVVVRDSDLVAVLGARSVDVVIDNVGGDAFPPVLEILKRGGRYVSSGAIAGPVVDLDLRTMYLNDQTLIGCTAWDEPVFPNLIGYIERGEIRPLLERTFPLTDIALAQQEFVKKNHVGKFVLVP